MGTDAVSLLNAASTAVTAIATVVLTWVAILQILHRKQERDERNARLNAAAKVEATLIRRELRESVSKLDAIERGDLNGWRNDMQTITGGLATTERRVARLAEIMIENRAGHAAVVDEVLRTFYEAADNLNPLAAHDSPSFGVEEFTGRTDRGRKQLLNCIVALEREFGLPALPPQYQPTKQPTPWLLS